jgi:hypothetical protein
MKKYEFCSPSVKNKIDNTCYTKLQLKEITKQYNKHHSPHIRINSKNITELLNNQLKYKVGDNRPYLWPKYLLTFSHNEILYNIMKNTLMPEKPLSWNKNPNQWLSNLDIDAILYKYSKESSFLYDYLGCKSIDFAVIKNGSCSFDSDCRIDIKKSLDKNKKYIGIILNLDKHNGPGYHWVSLFICLDPLLDAYGIYYYDSTSSKMPIIVKQYTEDIQSQALIIFKKNLPFYTNNIQHQYGNTECGMFSIYQQIVWINQLKKNKKIKFLDIINEKIDDKKMTDMRNILFRPNNFKLL